MSEQPSAENDAVPHGPDNPCEPKCHGYGIGCPCNPRTVEKDMGRLLLLTAYGLAEARRLEAALARVQAVLDLAPDALTRLREATLDLARAGGEEPTSVLTRLSEAAVKGTPIPPGTQP